MNLRVPRYLIVATAAVFSAYHLILATVSIQVPRDKAPYILAMILYALATTASLWPSKRLRMPTWLAASNLGVALVTPILVTSQLGINVGDSYAAWHTAAIGTLMVIVSTRRRQLYAWLGIIVLIVQTVLWAGPIGLVLYGVIGSTAWVGVSYALARSLAKAARDTKRYALAEREAVEWRAAQEAHVSVRQFRLEQTSRMALPMLRTIHAAHGRLTDAQRLDCVYLEGGIRDEIRGRKLLNDRVREQVIAARRKGTIVHLLDEGGIDDLDDADLERVLNRLADAIRDTDTGKLIARTVPGDSLVAVTVVGLTSAGDGHASALGSHSSDDDDDEVDLWLEIPRSLPAELSAQ